MYDCSYTNQLLIQHEFLISYNHNTCKSKKTCQCKSAFIVPRTMLELIERQSALIGSPHL